MSRPRRRWKVVVIVEDRSDGRALCELCRAAGVRADIDWLPANGIGNIKRKADLLIEMARARIGPGPGCVAVVVDRDGRDAARHEPHKSIRDACRSGGAEYVEAVEALEAWFLADEGVCAWLDLPARGTTDGVARPKTVVADAYYARTRRKYARRGGCTHGGRHAAGPSETRSRSWADAMEQLRSCGVAP